MARGVGPRQGSSRLVQGGARGPGPRVVPGRKKNKGLVINFDEDAFREFVTGFRKRKEERRKEGQKRVEEMGRKKRLEDRAARRLQLKIARGQLQADGTEFPPEDDAEAEEGEEEGEAGGTAAAGVGESRQHQAAEGPEEGGSRAGGSAQGNGAKVRGRNGHRAGSGMSRGGKGEDLEDAAPDSVPGGVEVYEDPDFTTVVTVSDVLDEDPQTGSIWDFPQLPTRHHNMRPNPEAKAKTKAKTKSKASGSKGIKAARKKAQAKGPRRKQNRKGRRK